MTRMAQMDRELKRARDRRNQHKPGTYRYAESHALGLPGLRGYITRRTRDLLKQRERLLNENR